MHMLYYAKAQVSGMSTLNLLEIDIGGDDIIVMFIALVLLVMYVQLVVMAHVG